MSARRPFSRYDRTMADILVRLDGGRRQALSRHDINQAWRLRYPQQFSKVSRATRVNQPEDYTRRALRNLERAHLVERVGVAVLVQDFAGLQALSASPPNPEHGQDHHDCAEDHPDRGSSSRHRQ